MPAGENPAKITDALRGGQLLLTPNQRAARTLRELHNQTHAGAGHLQWQPANVLPLDTWLGTLWHLLLLRGPETRLLLNRTQQHALWREIIAADPEVPGLRSADLLAGMAADAWSLLSRHSGRGRLREFTASTDTRAFARWAAEFDRRNTRLGYLPPAQLAEALTHAIPNLHLPDVGLTLVDFDDLPPAQEAFFEGMERAGYPVDRIVTTVESTPHLHPAPDDPAELLAVAHWSRELLTRDPATRIAIVLPDQSARRFALEQTLGAVLQPEARPITAAPAAPLFEFSLGLPLAESPAVVAALDLLRWPLAALPLERISALLLSPSFGAAGADALATANFDFHTLRQLPLLRPELSLQAFLDIAQSAKQALPPALLRQLRALRHALPDPTTPRPHELWSDTFRAALDDAAWLPERPSQAFQLQRRFSSALDELATLDFDARRTDAAGALRALTRICSETIFAPESASAPIQILGPLELGGHPFDALWFLAADDLTWPPPAASSPFIPWAIAQSLALPGTDGTRDRRRAQLLTDRIGRSAPHAVFSYALHAEDGLHRASPLLGPLPPLDLPTLPATSAPIPLELHPDTLAIAPLPDAVIRGGASILQAQAACPFRAFAEKRLRSSGPESRETGLDARDRGVIVHDVMEHFWAALGDQPALKLLPTAAQHELLDQAIDHALARTRTSTPWDRAYLAVQRQRLRDLLRPWLLEEAKRPPFAVTEHERAEHDITLGPLRLSVRVDRVDDTELGTVILDYKTGAAAPSEWLTPRPEAPQLPLYAVLAATPPAGVAFALLRPGKGLALCGYADSGDVFGKPARMELELPDQIDEWRTTLTQLAQDFANGHAEVDPRAYPKTCSYCDQRILCRLDPTTLEAVEEEAPDV